MKAWDLKSKHKLPDGYEIVIHNPLEYAPHVEYGHRIMNKKGGKVKGFKKGTFMMKNTETEMAFIMQELLEEKYEQFLRDVLE